MGDSSIFGILNDILLQNINSIKKESIYFEKITFQAFNIYFEVENKKYQMSIELDSGTDIYLKYHNGYRKNGDLLFEPDPIMFDLDFKKEIYNIKNSIKSDYELRLKFMVELICNKINKNSK